MWYPNRRQWWVIWVATTLVLLAWWSDLDRAAIARTDERLSADADWTQLQKAVDETLLLPPDARAKPLDELLRFQGQYLRGVADRARAEERLPRTVGSVVALAGLLVWFLGGRSRRGSD